MAELKQKSSQAEFVRWFGPLLNALRQLGGSGKPKEVVSLIFKNEHVPEEKQKEKLLSGGLRLPNQIAFARQYLVWEGLLESNVHGLWELSPTGYNTKLDEFEAGKIFLKWVEIHQNRRNENNKKAPPTGAYLRDVDSENEDVTDDFLQSFNPKDIDITVETRSLDSIISRIKHGDIDMNTYFQRKGDLWSNTIMSRLIESILIRFPLPAFYFDATDDDNWLIVDGLQRLSAIIKFVLNTDPIYVHQTYKNIDIELNRHKPLKLTGLEYLQDYNGKTYLDLPSNMQRRLKEAQITTYLVKPGTPEDVVYSVFYRINTGGLMLNPQEIRHALNQNGKGPEFLEEMSELDIFKQTVKISDKRMQDRELALRYVAFRLHHFQSYKPSMVRFLNKVMKDINYLSEDELFALKDELSKSLNTCQILFGEHAFSKSIAFSDYKSSLNRALFETWTVTLSTMNSEQIDRIIERKNIVLKAFKELLKNVEFDKAISISTTGFPQVIYRFEQIDLLLKNALND